MAATLGLRPVLCKSQMEQRLVLGYGNGVGWEMRLMPPWSPWIGPLHQAFKSRVVEEALQPAAQALQPLITVKSLRIGNPPLTHKWEQGPVRQRTSTVEKPAS